jgi:hypothetical protein
MSRTLYRAFVLADPATGQPFVELRPEAGNGAKATLMVKQGASAEEAQGLADHFNKLEITLRTTQPRAEEILIPPTGAV